jgi:Pyridoxamine 5'-phosphate oxidase
MSSPSPTPDLHSGLSAPGGRPTPWRDGVDVLESAELFWISTVGADGRPHVTPLPALWRDGALHFCTGAGEQKALNLHANDQCDRTTGDNR